MFSSGQDGGRPLLVGTFKVVAAIGFLSFCAANWLSGSSLDQRTLSRLAAATAQRDDPVTTGSITRAAGQTRLDPCAMARQP